MAKYHDKPRPGRIAEPAQVYLEAPDLERLARLTTQLEATKSDVLRRGLAALEREMLDPEQHPALRLIGIGRGAARRPGLGYDAAREHDRFLADVEAPPATKRKGRRGAR
jgi:hypothetical protein